MDETGLQAYVLHANRQAMDLLRRERFDACLRLLRDAQQRLDSSDCGAATDSLLAITLNNLACFYKRTHKPLHALKYLYQALHIESEANSGAANLAGTYLNICAIRSQLGKHQTALEDARKALEVMAGVKDLTINTVSTLAIAYHNAGVELEYLSRLQEAEEMFRTGWETVRPVLGAAHPLVQSLYASMNSLAEKRCAHSRNRSLETTIRNLTQRNSPKRAKAATPVLTRRPKTRAGIDLAEEPQRTGALNLSGLMSALESTQSRHKSSTPQPTRGVFPHRQRSLKSSRIKRNPAPAQPFQQTPNFKRPTVSNQNLERRVERIDSELQSLRKQMASGALGRLSAPNIPPRPSSQLSSARRSTAPTLTVSIKAELVQTLRGYLLRATIKKRTKAAVKLQSFIRKKQCSALYRNIRAAVMFIQKVWRDRRKRQNKP